ncbi:glycosyltransferase [bacterium]|nr:glycosyltransferase [bacterium]
MKVALVHEWLTTLGGSERVVWAFHRMFPDAPVFTTVHRRDLLPAEFGELDVRPSFLQRLPGGTKHYQKLLPLMPLAFEQFDLTGYDLVLSSAHACAKGVVTRPETVHVSYTHTPMRYAWDLYHSYQATVNPLLRPVSAALLSYLRQWDVLAANRVDRFVANSREVARRIQKHYRRPAEVVPPPIDVERFQPAPASQIGDHLLVLSRLVPYKRVDLAVQAANLTGMPLKIIGDGPLYAELKAMARPNVQFLGHLNDAEVAGEMARCRALVFGAFEDFGIVPLEAQAAGRPVVAFGAGGALETVIDGVTGAFFPEQRAESLVQALKRLDRIDFEPAAIRRHAESFAFEAFAARMRGVIDQAIAERRDGVFEGVSEAVHG